MCSPQSGLSGAGTRVDARTVEHWTWALSTHLLPFFADCKASQVTPALVERYKAGKLAERQEQLEVAVGEGRPEAARL